jgi:hypothetical protein
MLVDGSNSGMEVEMGNVGFGWAAASSSDGQVAQSDLDADVTTIDSSSPPVVVGSVVTTAATLEVRPDGGDAVDIPLLPAPASTGLDRSYFLTELPNLASTKGEVVALDASGAVIARQAFDTTGMVSGPPVACPGGAGGANVEPADCPPLPTACPMIPAGSSVKDCLICPDNAMCAVPSCPATSPPGNAPELACIACREVTTSNGTTETNTACPMMPPTCPTPVAGSSGSDGTISCVCQAPTTTDPNGATSSGGGGCSGVPEPVISGVPASPDVCPSAPNAACATDDPAPATTPSA